jgi:hypothetical protein
MVDYDLTVKQTSGLFRSGRGWNRPDTTVGLYSMIMGQYYMYSLLMFQVAITRMSLPYGICQNLTDAEIKAREAYLEQLPGTNYSVSGCLKTCLQKAIVQTCNCKYGLYAFRGEAFNNTAVPAANFCQMDKTDTSEYIPCV